MVMDNLHRFLSRFDANEPEFLGRFFRNYHNAFYSGGPGTVLSKGALKLLGDAVNAGRPVFSEHDTFADDGEFLRI